MNLAAIQTLWIGPRLSMPGRLTIQSFLDQGHPVHVYGYRAIDNVPDGATSCDAREIYPEEEVFVYRRGAGKGSPSAFSNLFRYRLLELKGGWWSDLDVVCLRPLEFPQQHVLGLERRPDGSQGIASALMKAPPDSPLMRHCRRGAQQADRHTIRWGQIGPQLVTHALSEIGESLAEPAHVLPPDAFSPINYWEIEQLVTASEPPLRSHAIHLYHEMWRRKRLDTERQYAPGSIYEQLIRKHLGEPARGTASRPHWLRRILPSPFGRRQAPAGGRKAS